MAKDSVRKKVKPQLKKYEKITEEIVEIAEKLLKENKVEKVIGFGIGIFTEEVTPIFISKPEDADRLVFNSKAEMSLAKYLLNYKDQKVAIVAKPCDSRAIATYLAEDLIKRENVKIIGINGCPGIEDNTACEECDIRNPVIADYTVGKKMTEEEIEAKLKDKEDKIEKMSPAERKEYFQKEFERCTRCYACREACYVCYCEQCFTEGNQPEWVGDSVKLNDNFTYHLMRAMHMAGRCVNCGACEMACPEGIDVRALAAKMCRSAEELFDYRAGIDPEQKTLLSDYDVNDTESGFME